MQHVESIRTTFPYAAVCYYILSLGTLLPPHSPDASHIITLLLFTPQQEMEGRKRVEERRRDTLRLIEQEHRAAGAAAGGRGGVGDSGDPLDTINTDDEADDAEYEAWKLRELRRLKRDKVSQATAYYKHTFSVHHL